MRPAPDPRTRTSVGNISLIYTQITAPCENAKKGDEAGEQVKQQLAMLTGDHDRGGRPPSIAVSPIEPISSSVRRPSRSITDERESGEYQVHQSDRDRLTIRRNAAEPRGWQKYR